ncbi:MAG: DUF4395 domain-containing protein [Anaerolineae bacterium]|nr:DUF4395 domain-containing protein [Anaerolineae bacterium]
MQTLICPISFQRISNNVVRITGFMMALMIALFAATGLNYFLIIITIDYFIRAFTGLKYSPFSWIGHQLAATINRPDKHIDKGPKLFAARVGFLFAAAATGLFYLFPSVSLTVALVLMGFATLESVFDICVGCLVYSHMVFPIFGNK